MPCSSHPPAMAFPPTAQCDWSLSQNRTLHDFPHEEPSPPRTPATPARCKASGSLRQTDPRLARARWLRALGSHLPISASVPTVLGPGEGRGGGVRSCCLLTAHCVLCILGPQSSPTGTSVRAECLPWEQWAQGAVCRSLSIAPARPGRAPCEQVSPAHGGGGLSIMPRTELSRAYGGKVGRRAVQLHAHFYKGTGHRALQGGRSCYINTGRSPTRL